MRGKTEQCASKVRYHFCELLGMIRIQFYNSSDKHGKSTFSKESLMNQILNDVHF